MAFLRAVLPAAARVLEVGCGSGEVAAALGRDGHAVVAIDADPDAVDSARALGVDAACVSLLDYDAAPFDVVLFTRSLHHIDPLEAAVARARRLVADGGLVVADEFARERVDAETAAWHFDTCAVLADAGLLPEEPPGAGGDPLRRWFARFEAHGGHGHEHEHGHGHGAHGRHHMTTGAEMVAALSAAFTVTRLDERVPYQYRFVAERLPDTPEGSRVARRLLAIERRRIALSGGPWAGLRIVARAV
jgi:SAM-dependent methyltransferase